MRDGAIWLTNAAYLNDEQELTYSVTLARDVLRQLTDATNDPRLRTFLGTLSLALYVYLGLKSWFIASFSRAGNTLSQWRAYCPGGGYSLGFDGAALVRAAHSLGRCTYGRVLYDPERQRDAVRNVIARYIGTWRELRTRHADLSDEEYDLELGGIFSFSIAEALIFIKAPPFAEEEEWRLARYQVPDDEILFRSRLGILTPYMSGKLNNVGPLLPLRELYVGPLGESSLATHAVRLLCMKYPALVVHAPDYRLRF